jgi:hypothetical protein
LVVVLLGLLEGEEGHPGLVGVGDLVRGRTKPVEVGTRASLGRAEKSVVAAAAAAAGAEDIKVKGGGEVL